ncbi:MAG: hypothetical protein CFE49_06960 [Pseudomonas sp. PGPPP3]|nr:MAG: hypothetical protein CFE49_06960 [Pseudomonas sp. PGPPP3]
MSDLPESLPSQNPLAAEPLTSIEARVLGCLIEKQATTPETYPLTLNAVVLACNQKTSREPVLNLSPGEVGHALSRLVMGSRADRWEQRTEKQLELVHAQVILLGLLLLRGPQTLNELLTRSQRMHDFDDVADLQHKLERLISRELACLLPRQAGQREDRYMHLLGNPDDRQAAISARPAERHDSQPQDNRYEQLG